MTDFPLADYLRRIGLAAPPPLTVDGLLALTAAQVRRIPFENLDPYLGLPLALDADSLVQKLVYRGRGGYCFEVNQLLHLALLACGFLAERRLARVFGAGDRPGARTHQLSLVHIAGRTLLADCGFGRQSPRHALPLIYDRLEIQDGEAYRLRLDARLGSVLQYRQDGWRDIYAFDDTLVQDVDCEMGNFYTNCWPDSKFRRQLSCARVTDDGRVTLLDDRLREYRADGLAELAIDNAATLRRVLVQSFGLPEADLADMALAARLGLDAPG